MSSLTLSSPSVSPRTLVALFSGGLIGLVVWEVFARVLTPLVLGGPLEPAGLIISLFRSLVDVNPGRPAAEVIHYLTGIFFYPIGFYVLTRIASFGAVVDGIAWGVITWVLALGVFAGLAGLPFMLNFIPLTWMSLLGHVLYALVAAVAFYALRAKLAR